MSRTDRLKVALDRLVEEFDGPARLATDPLEVVRTWPREEWELVAHIVAPLSYGSVKLLRRACHRVLSSLSPSPTEWVRSCAPGDFIRRDPEFVYRMTRATDVDAYLVGLGALLREYGTLEAAFVAGDGGGQLADALGAYVTLLRSRMDVSSRGARYLTPHPRTGSACKRWHLMLRWLSRPDDGVDLGIWSLAPSRLVLPLDTHTARLVRWLDLSRRRSVDGKMAEEATARLRQCAPNDPMRYDMPLCHLGISRECRHQFVAEICRECPLEGICSWTVDR